MVSEGGGHGIGQCCHLVVVLVVDGIHGITAPLGCGGESAGPGAKLGSDQVPSAPKQPVTTSHHGT